MKEQAKEKKNDLFSKEIIPDYNYLFTEENAQGKKKSGFLSKILKANIASIILSLLVYLLQSLPIYLIPLCTAEIINVVTFAATNNVGFTTEVINKLLFCGLIIAVSLIQNVPTTRLNWKITSKMLRKTSAGLKSTVVRKLQSLSITYHKDMESGKIQSKFIKDTEEVDAFLALFVRSFFPNILSAIIYIAISIYKNGVVSLFFLVMIPINVAVSLAFRKRIRKTYRDYRVNSENMSVKLTTMLEMMPVTKSHGLEKVEIEQVEKTIKEVAGAGIEVDSVHANIGAWLYVVPAMCQAVCLIFCSCLAVYGYIQVGDIVLYQSLFSAISGYISAIVNALPQIGKGMEAVNSVSEIMHSSEVEAVGKVQLTGVEGNVDFENLTYYYPNAENKVIDNFNLSVKAGECIAVVGASGSGKTTLMNLIIGFMMPKEGEVKIDGKSIKELNLSEYRHNISVVPQNSILFNGTIKENITYGLLSYTEEQVEKVVEMANLKEFLAELPQGINTVVGENGAKLSGGQRQRITIARALIRNPKILILDEATSALDNVSEYHVQQAISTSIQGRTTFIVAHRLSTIRNADRIVVLENGVMVELGSYDELMAKRGKFYTLKMLSDISQKTAEENLK